MKQKMVQNILFFLIILCVTGSAYAELIEGYTQYPVSDPVVTLSNPSHLSVCYYREDIPISIPEPGPVVLIQFNGNEPQVQAVFDLAALGKTIYFRLNQTVKSYTIPETDDTFDWQSAETVASISDWEAPTGYYKMPSGSRAVSLINPLLYDVSFFHEDIDISLPLPGSVVSIDLTGSTAADIQLVCDAALAGTQIYITFNDIIKTYTLPESDELTDTFNWIDAPAFDMDSLTNRPPQMSIISDITSNEDEPYTLYFTLTDSETAPEDIQLTLISSNKLLLPDDQMIRQYIGNENSIYLMPSPNLSGQTTITMIASDGEKSVTQQFEFTVVAVNDPPEVSAIQDQYLNEDESHSLTVIFSDIDTLEEIYLSAKAGNKKLIPDDQISISNNVVSFMPAKDQFGETVMTVTVHDGEHEIRVSFDVTVISVNDPPVIKDISHQYLNEDEPHSLTVNVSDIDTLNKDINFKAKAYDTKLIPDNQISISNNVVTFTPAKDQFGETIMTVTAIDGDHEISFSFDVTVNPVNDPPSFEIPENQFKCSSLLTENLFYNFVSEIKAGPINEKQDVKFEITPKEHPLFEYAPHIDSKGTLDILPLTNVSGVASFTVCLKDSGSTEHGGCNISNEKKFTINIMPSKAIIVLSSSEKKYSNDTLWRLIKPNAEYANKVLLDNYYVKENICILRSDSIKGSNTDTLLENLQKAITYWAIDAYDLVLYMVGHGGLGKFRINFDQLLEASLLDSWLDTLQLEMPGRVTVIIDSCKSGSFLPILLPPNKIKKRVTITSTLPEQNATFLYLNGGLSFSFQFWSCINSGANLNSSFHFANDIMKNQKQTACIDSDGDGINNENDDEKNAEKMFIGYSRVIAKDKPYITEENNSTITLNGERSLELKAGPIISTNFISHVIAFIIPPDYKMDNSDLAVTNLESIEFFDTDEDNVYETRYSNFSQKGTYYINVYAIDSENMYSEPLSLTIVQNGIEPDDEENNNDIIDATLLLSSHELNFSDEGDEDWFLLNCSESIVYTFAVNHPESNCQAHIQLFDHSGINLLTSQQSESTGHPVSLTWTCIQDGEYFLKISNSDPSLFGFGTSYVLNTYNSQGLDCFENDNSFDTARVVSVTDSRPQQHSFHTFTDIDYSLFYAVPGNNYVFEAFDVDGEIDVVIELFNNNRQLIMDRNVTHDGSPEKLTWEDCTEEGIYYVCVRLSEESSYGQDTGYKFWIYMPIADPNGRINGFIADSLSLQSIAHATIRLFGLPISSLSHSSGIYRMRHDPGIYTIIVEATGYEQMSTPNIEIKEFSTTRQDFQLNPKMYTITLQKTGTGSGTIPFESTTVRYGESFTLPTPIPDAHSKFDGWSGDIQNLDFIDEDKTIIATFSSNNTPPVISSIGNMISNEDKTTSFDVSIADNKPDSLDEFSIVSSNTDLLPNDQLLITGDQTNKTITYTPKPDQFGHTSLTISVTDGEYTSTKTIDVTILPVNDAPSFELITKTIECENFSTENEYSEIVSKISAGPANEKQDVSFVVGSDNKELFESQPQITPDGTLLFTPDSNTTGTAILSVYLQDNGTDANGGVCQSDSERITIVITQGYVQLSGKITEKDSTTPIANAQITCLPITQPFISDTEGVYHIELTPGTYTLTIDAVGFENNTQTIVIENETTVQQDIQLAPKTFVITLIQTGEGNGTLPFESKTIRYGESLDLSDPTPDDDSIFSGWSGDIQGLNFIDENKIITATFSLKNTPPEIICDNTITSKEDEPGALTVTITDNNMKSLTISVCSSNTNLLSSNQIEITGDGTEKVMTYTPTANQFGSAIITISVCDDEYTSTTSIDVTILSVNDAPSFELRGTVVNCSNIPTNYEFLNFAESISAGPDNENQDITFNVTSDNKEKFIIPPEIDSKGKLVFVPHDYAIGELSITVALEDNGSTENGGKNISDTQTFTINVMPSKAIILAASSERNMDDDYLWPDIYNKGNDAYAVLNEDCSYRSEYINYLSSAPNTLNVDKLATKNNLEMAITDCYNAYDLVIYMVGHGGDGFYTIHDERIDAADLDSWLDDLQSNIPGKVVLIYDAPYSGSFISKLTAPSGKQRIVITSTSADQHNYSLYNGEISFSHSFWKTIHNCGSISFAFNIARFHMLPFQTAMIDTNGNGIANETEDFQPGSNMTIGTVDIIPSDSPYVDHNDQVQTLKGKTHYTISAGPVIDSNPLVHVIGIIQSPNDVIPDEIKTITDLEIIELSDPDQDNVYTYDYTKFTQKGSYYVHVYAKDTDSQYSEPVSLTYVQNVDIFTITIFTSGNGNGTLSFYSQTVQRGDRFEYPTYEEDECSTFDGWSETQGLENVQNDKTIIATFSLKQFIVNPISPQYGTITPSVPQSFKCGSSQTYTITANEGYHISDVMVNGTSVGAVQSYTFNEIKQAYKIQAIFDNSPPWISIIPDQSIDEDTALSPVPFTITDFEDTIPTTVKVESSNQGLVSIDNIVISGDTAHKTIALTPTHNMFGTTIITIEGIDSHGLAARQSFKLKIAPIADPGDINNDGVIDMIDLILTLQMLADFKAGEE
jgi:hypothetical protein